MGEKLENEQYGEKGGVGEGVEWVGQPVPWSVFLKKTSNTKH